MDEQSRSTVGTAVGERGWFLTIFAVLFAVLAFSNFTKAYQHSTDPNLGLVILGVRFESMAANLILGPLFGLILAAYAYGIWTMKRWVLPLSMAYAIYVPYNLVLFWFLNAGPRPTVRFIVGYLAIALSGSVGTALYL
ncbi:MAG: hypothetical protein ACREQF_05955, partial [Candidatus Binataceae bacterium]